MAANADARRSRRRAPRTRPPHAPDRRYAARCRRATRRSWRVPPPPTAPARSSTRDRPPPASPAHTVRPSPPAAATWRVPPEGAGASGWRRHQPAATAACAAAHPTPDGRACHRATHRAATRPAPEGALRVRSATKDRQSSSGGTKRQYNAPRRTTPVLALQFRRGSPLTSSRMKAHTASPTFTDDRP